MTANSALSNIDLSSYLGEWVVVCNKKIVAHDKKLSKLSRFIETCKTTPTVARIPEEDALIF